MFLTLWLIAFITRATLRWKRLCTRWSQVKVKGTQGRRGKKAEFLAVGETCKAMFHSTPGFNTRTFNSSGFSAEGTLISAPTISRHKGWLSRLHSLNLTESRKMFHYVVLVSCQYSRTQNKMACCSRQQQQLTTESQRQMSGNIEPTISTSFRLQT